MSRNKLHVTKLEEFASYCESQGFKRVNLKGEYEALRMVRSDVTLIVHKKLQTFAGNDTVHLTLHGASEIMFKKWKRSSQTWQKNHSFRRTFGRSRLT